MQPLYKVGIGSIHLKKWYVIQTSHCGNQPSGGSVFQHRIRGKTYYNNIKSGDFAPLHLLSK
ncbi:MAG: hypothetical protein SAJ37_06965 [Oscillatoria sp. PMC 1068.18]|nr:hypothetical protein [Oscillatoria sp. PMC 1076.18]MEC4988473.1 hypothetical protein [Oscillatoria sp. PMC 1068.18]